MRLDLSESEGVPEPLEAFKGDPSTTSAYLRAGEEAREQAAKLYTNDTSAMDAQIERATELEKMDIEAGVRCLSTMHTAEMDPVVQAYGAYLQARPRLLTEKDAAARVDKPLAARFPGYVPAGA